MKLNARILISGLILALVLSCQNRNKEFNSEYLIGEWTFCKVVEKVNGIEMENPKLSHPIRYEFIKNGTVVFGPNNIGKGKWEITKDNSIIMGSEDVFFEHIPDIESYSKMKLTLTFENKFISYYYERGWSE